MLCKIQLYRHSLKIVFISVQVSSQLKLFKKLCFRYTFCFKFKGYLHISVMLSQMENNIVSHFVFIFVYTCPARVSEKCVVSVKNASVLCQCTISEILITLKKYLNFISLILICVNRPLLCAYKSLFKLFLFYSNYLFLSYGRC